MAELLSICNHNIFIEQILLISYLNEEIMMLRFN